MGNNYMPTPLEGPEVDEDGCYTFGYERKIHPNFPIAPEHMEKEFHDAISWTLEHPEPNVPVLILPWKSVIKQAPVRAVPTTTEKYLWVLKELLVKQLGYGVDLQSSSVPKWFLIDLAYAWQEDTEAGVDELPIAEVIQWLKDEGVVVEDGG